MTEGMPPTPTKQSSNRTLIIVGVVILACVLLCVCVTCILAVLGPLNMNIFSSMSQQFP